MAIEISTTMKDALQMAWTDGGGQLHRWPGGYWCARMVGVGDHPRHTAHQGATTITALINRGLVRVVDTKENAQGEFPIRVEMTLAGVNALPAGAMNANIKEKKA